MARPLRIQYAGAVYHITCRGNERKNIFKDDIDRKKILDILAQSLKNYSTKLYSYVLMDNHFHLLIETPLGNLAEFMRHFNITYTGYYNRRHKRTGHLYQGRYKSILVEKGEYLSLLSRYIHLNPVNIKRIKEKKEKEKIQYLKSYKWSSLPGYINSRKIQKLIDYSIVLAEYGGDNNKGRLAYKSRIYAEISLKPEIKEKVVGQSILGKDAFIEWVMEEFIDKGKGREVPAMKELQRYRSEEVILGAIKGKTGKSLEDLKREKASYRQIAMDMLYRFGGMKGEEIGRMFDVGYTAVSQERRRLNEKLKKDRKLRILIGKIERHCE